MVIIQDERQSSTNLAKYLLVYECCFFSQVLILAKMKMLEEEAEGEDKEGHRETG